MSLWLPVSLMLPLGAAAQTASAAVPQAHVPPPVLMELRALESQFEQALLRDCAPERCFSKGCVYRDHVGVDRPRSGSLPGLGQAEGPGSVPMQEYLTQARCELTHEKSLSARDVQVLKKRLEQRLSKGWLQVTVNTLALEPVSPSLRESPAPPPEPAPVELPPPGPAAWDTSVAFRELWVSLLPHFSWMIALVMVTLGALTLIWALRRVGKESLEEKAMAAQLLQQAALQGSASSKDSPAADPVAEAALADAEKTKPPDPDELAFIQTQEALWAEKISASELAKDESAVVELLRHWLQAGEFAMLAKAIFKFGNQLSLAFSKDGELAARKIEFAEFLRTVDERKLPADAEFFRKLNHHAVSSSVLSQSDVELYRSLREEFGAAGVARLVENIPGALGAKLFGLVPPDCQQEAARLMSPALRNSLATHLMLSNRISRQEMEHLFGVLRAARAGQPIPQVPTTEGILDRGREFDAAGALSVLFQHIDPQARGGLFAELLQRTAGALPRWYENILYPDMLLRLPQELQADVLLDVDVKGLAGWSSVQSPRWRESFISRLAPAMQSAVRASMAFSSREDQLRLAREGHDGLVSAMKKQVAQGKVSFAEILS